MGPKPLSQANSAGDDPEDQDLVREVVPAVLAGERIDRLVSLVADISRSEAAELLAEGRVRVNGSVPSKSSQRVGEGDHVEVMVPIRSTALTPDVKIEVSIVHEDDHVLVVDKPAQLIVHPGSGVDSGTLVHGLLARYPDLVGVGEPERPGIVHRLDKGTSGLLMVARTTAAYDDLTAQLVARTVGRRYSTLVAGSVDSEEGVVDAPLGRSPRQATLRAVVADGRPARTHYRVMARFPDADCCLVECRLETGRTHQIRVHMSAIGHPVIGDHRYGAPTESFGLKRPFLHAKSLGFRHPSTGDEMEFKSPLPDDLSGVLDGLNT